MNEEEVKKNRTMEFLKSLGTAWDSLELKKVVRQNIQNLKDLFGFPLPEFGVSEYLGLPNLLEKDKKF